MKIEPIYVTFEQAKLLKAKEFKQSTIANYWILAKDHTENYNKRLPADETKIFFCKNSNELSEKTRIDEDMYSNVYYVFSVPEQWQVVEWLRLVHGIHVRYTIDVIGSDEWCYGYTLWYIPKEFDSAKRRCPHLKEIDSFKEVMGTYTEGWDTPQEAYSAAFDYTLKELL